MHKKNLIFLILTVFIISLFSMTLSGNDNVKIPKKVLKIEKKADKAKIAKKFDKAVELYKKAIKIFPDYYKVHYSLASIYALNKNYTEAIKELKIAKKLNNSDENIVKALSDTMLKYGNSFLKSRKLKEANNIFIEMMAIDGFKKVYPKLFSEMLYRIGFNYFALKDRENSEIYMTRFLNVENADKDFSKFYSMANYLLGINSSSKNEYEKSNKYLKTFIDLNSANPANKYVTFAKYIIASNDFAVLKPLVTNIKKLTNRKNIKENDAKIKKLTEKYTDIEKNLIEVIEKNPSIEDAYVILGNFYYLKNDMVNCIKYYKTLIEKFPSSKDVDIYKGFLKGIQKSK